MSEKYIKKQHYIPRMLLKKWSSDGKTLNGFNKITLENKVLGINNVCVQNDLYEVKDRYNNYINRNYIECKMAEMECAFADYLEDLEYRILHTAQEHQSINLSNKDIFGLIYWLTFLASRNPKTTQKIRDLAKDFDVSNNESFYQILHDAIINYPLSFTANNIDKVSLNFVVSDEAKFIASDSMVNMEFGSNKQIIPLSPDLAVQVRLDKRRMTNFCQIIKIDKKHVDDVNYEVFKGAERFVFLADNSSLP